MIVPALFTLHLWANVAGRPALDARVVVVGDGPDCRQARAEVQPALQAQYRAALNVGCSTYIQPGAAQLHAQQQQLAGDIGVWAGKRVSIDETQRLGLAWYLMEGGWIAPPLGNFMAWRK